MNPDFTTEITNDTGGNKLSSITTKVAVDCRAVCGSVPQVEAIISGGRGGQLAVGKSQTNP